MSAAVATAANGYYPGMRPACLLFVLTMRSLLAQDTATIGTFVDLEGRPVANATVTFATSPPDRFDLLEPPHVVETKTDASGRFRIQLRTGASHSAWAIGPAGENGRWRSAALDGVVPGSIVALQAKELSATRAARIEGLAQLGDGPFTAVVRAPAMHAPNHELPVASDGSLSLPELPAGAPSIRLLGPDGRLAVGHLAFASDGTATISPVRQQLVEVVDEHGKPVAGARVGALTWQWLGGGPLQFATRNWHGLVEGPPTDSEGRSRLPWGPFPPAVVAWSGGKHARIARAGSQPIVDGALVDGTDEGGAVDRPVRLVLRDGPALRGVLRRGQQPLAGNGVVAKVTVQCETNGGASRRVTWFSHVERSAAAADGTFEFAALPRPIGVVQLLVATGDDVPTLVLARGEVPATPLVVDLDAWPLVTLQLRTDSAVPPSAVRFLLWPGDPELEHVDPIVLVGDRSGSARARLEPGRWFLVCTDGDGIATELVTVRGRDPILLQPKLAPLARMRGRIVDTEGRPVGGAKFLSWGWSSMDPELRTERDKLCHAHFGVINDGLIPMATSGADGRFEVRLMDLPSCKAAGRVSGTGGTAEVDYRPGEDLEIRLRQN